MTEATHIYNRTNADVSIENFVFQHFFNPSWDLRTVTSSPKSTMHWPDFASLILFVRSFLYNIWNLIILSKDKQNCRAY